MIVDGLEGFIVPPDNSLAIAQHIEKILANPTLHSLLARAIRPVKTITDNAAEYDAFYRLAIGTKHAHKESLTSPVFLSNIRLTEHYLQRGDIQKALKYFEKAASLLPNHPTIKLLRRRFVS